MGIDGDFGLIIPGLHLGLVERPFQGRKTKPGTENGRVFRPERPVLSAQVGGLGIDGRPGNRREAWESTGGRGIDGRPGERRKAWESTGGLGIKVSLADSVGSGVVP